MKPSLGKK